MMPLPTAFVSRKKDMTAARAKGRVLATGLVLLVVATFVIASMVELSDTRSSVARWVDDEADLVQEDVTEVIGTVLADLESIAAFVEEGHPTSSSFATFV